MPYKYVILWSSLLNNHDDDIKVSSNLFTVDKKLTFFCSQCHSSVLSCIAASPCLHLAGFRKSLAHVFQDGICHPKMAMVIDDRLEVWDEKDQPRVHVVPAFSPYYAPQAEVLI